MSTYQSLEDKFYNVHELTPEEVADDTGLIPKGGKEMLMATPADEHNMWITNTGRNGKSYSVMNKNAVAFTCKDFLEKLQQDIDNKVNSHYAFGGFKFTISGQNIIKTEYSPKPAFKKGSWTPAPKRRVEKMMMVSDVGEANDLLEKPENKNIWEIHDWKMDNSGGYRVLLVKYST